MQVSFVSKRPVMHLTLVRMEQQDNMEVISITVITEQLLTEHIKFIITVLAHRIVKILYLLQTWIQHSMVVKKR